MKPFFTILIFLSTLCYPLLAQERTISGRLTSTEDGSPLPGINITIKGTNIGTTTNADGYYSIQVPIGSTLVFSFVGMQTREMVVTENNFRPANSQNKQERLSKIREKADQQPISNALFKDSTAKQEIGVATLNNETPTYNSNSVIVPSTIRSIKQRGNHYSIQSDNDPVRRTGFALQFTTSWGLDQINKLPAFQNQYAQGRSDGSNFQWQGADKKELFSWGPLVRTLEFDGSSYPFDKNGRLVPVGTGTGALANKYDASSFFKKGFSNANELVLTMPGPKTSILIFDLEHRTRTGIIPNSQYKKTNFTSSLRQYKIAENIRATASLSYNQSAGNLLSRGANLASIVGSVYRTPVTFDNANALSPTSAIYSNESYTLPDNTKRSHAPGVADNPIGLVNELPDNEALQRLMASANLNYNPNTPFSIVFNGNIDQQWNKSIFGTAPGYSGYPSGRLTNRKDNQTLANAILTAAYRYQPNYDNELKLSLSYQVEHSARELNRMDGFHFNSSESFASVMEADSIVKLKNASARTSHEIIMNAQYEYNSWLNVRFTNRSYFSNTIQSNRYTNFFPTAGVSANLANLLAIWSFDELKLYATLSRTIREAPLLYSNWSYGSTNMTMENYTSFYEQNELFFSKNLSPETERKFETGVRLRSLDGRLTVELTYYNNLTKDFVAPMNTPAGFSMQNIAAIKNYGGTITAAYNGYMTNGHWGTDLKWSRYNSVVEALYSSDDWVAIAGFHSALSVFAPGQSVGALYGTTYVRNAEGKKVIGHDGFPLEDTNLKIIGNPIPDWILGWSAYSQWKQLRLSFLFDFKKGGEIWNGTHSAMDYLGRSASTEMSRSTANYIFEGVDVNGNPNTIPVNFYDPAKPINDNRWVRYGWDGVGEDYIEDASWIRLSELTLSYTTKRKWTRSTVKEMKFSLIGRNLFLITPYSGVDPSATLFGYGNGNGLDLFNTPSTRSYNAQITIKI